MDQILSLREKRAKAWDAAKAFLDAKRGSDGLISAEDAATYDRMEAEVVNLGKEIERLERQASIDRELSAPAAAGAETAMDPLATVPAEMKSFAFTAATVNGATLTGGRGAYLDQLGVSDETRERLRDRLTE